MRKLIHLIISLVALMLISYIEAYPQGAAINTSGAAPDASAGLDIQFNNRGLLIPRMTTTERNAIASPAQGLQIFNTTTNCFEFYLGTLWQTMACGCTSAPSAPSAGTQVPGQYQVEWNWNAVAGATGYKWNTVDVYSSATDAGASTILTQTSLNCNTAYTLYVWAYNFCGNSSSVTLSANTTACPFPCGTNLSLTHTAGSVAPVTKSVTYGTVSTGLSGATKCWITRNLGADNQATSVTDNTEAAAGWYWQFNKPRGYKHTGSARTPNTTWIDAINENSDWTSGNDPCTSLLGTGWRLPTYTEWFNADAGWSNYNDQYSSVLKIHAAGYLAYSDGSLNGRGNYPYYWSLTQYDNTRGRNVQGHSGGSFMDYNYKSTGMTARCLNDN